MLCLFHVMRCSLFYHSMMLSIFTGVGVGVAQRCGTDLYALPVDAKSGLYHRYMSFVFALVSF